MNNTSKQYKAEFLSGAEQVHEKSMESKRLDQQQPSALKCKKKLKTSSRHGPMQISQQEYIQYCLSSMICIAAQ